MNPKEEMDEYYLKDIGIAGGRLGSMNMSNPQKNISSYITKLTGISNEMVQNQPTFDLIARNITQFITERN